MVVVRVEIKDEEIENLLERINRTLSFIERDDVFRTMLNMELGEEREESVEYYRKLVDALRRTVEQVEDIEKRIDVEKVLRRLEVIP